MYLFTDRLIVGVMPNLKVRMLECIFAADPLCGVKAKHLAKQVDRQGIGVGIERTERNTRLDRERTNVVLSSR